ncbi:MAG TPA: hypothetical protein VHY19_16285 [Steroidobacteraceae bacterium]|jgi:hypothetical protein|nr:hypothetical protein [Steroidobacteraceae bacterium]
MAILSGITQRPQSDVPRWLQTTFGARDVLYQPVWLTSLPPKRRLDFSLENRRYHAVLTITDQGAWPLPVQAAPRYRCSSGRCDVMPDRAPLKAPAR